MHRRAITKSYGMVQVRSLALYLSEMSLVDGENFLRFPPSQVNTQYTHQQFLINSVDFFGAQFISKVFFFSTGAI